MKNYNVIKIFIFSSIFFVILFFASCNKKQDTTTSGENEKKKNAENLDINAKKEQKDFPHVTKIGYAKYDIVFSDVQQKAINDFLINNSKLTLLIDDNYGANIDGDIEGYMNSGIMQHRYASWSDFNKDSFQDFMLLFVYSNLSENPYHPKGYVYNLVIFQGNSESTYDPKLIHKEKNGIIDGITYDKLNSIISFSNFDVAEGSIEWVDKKYKVTEMMGD